MAAVLPEMHSPNFPVQTVITPMHSPNFRVQTVITDAHSKLAVSTLENPDARRKLAGADPKPPMSSLSRSPNQTWCLSYRLPADFDNLIWPHSDARIGPPPLQSFVAGSTADPTEKRATPRPESRTICGDQMRIRIEGRSISHLTRARLLE